MPRKEKMSDEDRKASHKRAYKKWADKPETKKKLAEYSKNKRKRKPEVRMLDCSRYRAKRKGMEFSISVEDIVIPELCPILLIPLKLNNESLKRDSPTLDRVDTSKGYIKGNVRVISHRANSCKSDLSIDSVRRMLAYMEGKL